MDDRPFSENDLYADVDMAGRPSLHEAPPFGQRLATVRKTRGLSQTQLAKLLGKSREMIDYYERRAKNPSMEVILKAAEVLHIPANELLGGEVKFNRKPGPPSRLQELTEKLSDLPRTKQRVIVEMLEGFLQKTSNGHKQAA